MEQSLAKLYKRNMLIIKFRTWPNFSFLCLFDFVLQPGYRDGPIQCFIKRDKSKLTYHLFLCLSPGKLYFIWSSSLVIYLNISTTWFINLRVIAFGGMYLFLPFVDPSSSSFSLTFFDFQFCWIAYGTLFVLGNIQSPIFHIVCLCHMKMNSFYPTSRVGSIFLLCWHK